MQRITAPLAPSTHSRSSQERLRCADGCGSAVSGNSRTSNGKAGNGHSIWTAGTKSADSSNACRTSKVDGKPEISSLSPGNASPSPRFSDGSMQADSAAIVRHTSRSLGRIPKARLPRHVLSICFAQMTNPGAEVYSCAVTRDQARICWEVAQANGEARTRDATLLWRRGSDPQYCK